MVVGVSGLKTNSMVYAMGIARNPKMLKVTGNRKTTAAIIPSICVPVNFSFCLLRLNISMSFFFIILIMEVAPFLARKSFDFVKKRVCGWNNVDQWNVMGYIKTIIEGGPHET